MIIKPKIVNKFASYCFIYYFYTMKTMKYLFIALMLITISANAQEKKNNNRVKIGISGVMLIGGSVVNIAKVYSKEPVYETGSNVDTYLREVKTYQKSQKQLATISSVMYGLGGISLLTIKINF